jgi:lysozyme
MPAPSNVAKVAGALAAASLAVPMIASFEGLRNVGYLDSTGLATTCWGHVKTAKLGVYSSDDQCIALLAQDAAEHAVLIQRCITVAVPPPSLAAFTSFAFNLGVGNFCNSTMARKLNAGDLVGACNELPRWNKA